MVTYQSIGTVNSSAEDAFNVLGVEVCGYNPKWEREVIEIRPVTQGPIALGSRAIMVRENWGRRSEDKMTCTEFEPGRRIAWTHPNDSMDFDISFEVTPIEGGSCTLQTDVRMQPKGWMRVFEPVVRLNMCRRSDRPTASMVDVIEGADAGVPRD